MDKYREGIFAVVYAHDGSEIKYIVLKRKLHWRGWEFPKGGIGENETEEDTVKREVREENPNVEEEAMPHAVPRKWHIV